MPRIGPNTFVYWLTFSASAQVSPAQGLSHVDCAGDRGLVQIMDVDSGGTEKLSKPQKGTPRHYKAGAIHRAAADHNRWISLLSDGDRSAFQARIPLWSGHEVAA